MAEKRCVIRASCKLVEARSSTPLWHRQISTSSGLSLLLFTSPVGFHLFLLIIIYLVQAGRADSVCVCVWDTNVDNEMCIDRYYKEKVIYEDILSVLIIQMRINHTKLVFWGEVEMQSLLWGLSFGVGK